MKTEPIALTLVTLMALALTGCGPASPVLTPTVEPAIAAPEPEATAETYSGQAVDEHGDSAIDNAESPLFAEPQSVIFSMDAAQPNMPADVLAEVVTTSGGGGGGCGAATQPSLFATAPNEPNVEQMAVLDILGCNWKAGDAVIVMARLPDGQTLDFQADVGSDGTFLLPFQTALQDAPGIYTFEVKGSDGAKASDSIEVSAPDGPRMRSYGDRLFLYNFSPGERLRLIAYRFVEAKNAYAFAGWQSFKTDANGRLFIDLDESAQGPLYAFGIVGDASGPVSEFAVIGAIDQLVP